MTQLLITDYLLQRKICYRSHSGIYYSLLIMTAALFLTIQPYLCL